MNAATARRNAIERMVLVVQDACLSGDFDLILDAVDRRGPRGAAATARRVICNIVVAGGALERHAYRAPGSTKEG